MARYPNAIWKPLTGRQATFTGGPRKIVHHTTEGGSAIGAIEYFTQKGTEPHFTVDHQHVWQHLDTEHHAYALRNKPSGPPETNRDGAIQIEVVGFAHLPKGEATLKNVALLCRWLEQEHGIPKVWPNGYPKPAKNGKDPGNHDRDPVKWDNQGGHFGHCHVPKNDHWDPGYSREEVEFLMTWSEATQAHFSLHGQLPEGYIPTPSFEGVVSTMPDHGAVDDE